MDTLNSLIFARQFLRNPKQIGSVTPSSRFLAARMLNAVPWGEVNSVAELGAGTGAITEILQHRVGSRTKVFLFEKDADMRERLERRFPGFSIHANAANVWNEVNRHGVRELDCILSGLPFFNFTQNLRDALMDQIRSSLKDNGYFVAFQYSLQMKKQFARRFVIEDIQFVPFNFPPAFVYICRKRNV